MALEDVLDACARLKGIDVLRIVLPFAISIGWGMGGVKWILYALLIATGADTFYQIVSLER
jgi:hypothetical protein